ncbi:sigma-70 family RNA polymerase sigma factor [Evansella sp. LMS18]|uniref:sigma-70 family RNA polymerase sigma factor n=1 Tax=Evansella sp. LMS18 TaxID=2924033 RepID=UPI0020D0588D|nr:sigma-70 family RNA polymerase sigma factor [Evansella sp. LMS18]UTR10006.1 sigma-70 family RNA polymerase sigma factor [Evansella sp. LMS18]
MNEPEQMEAGFENLDERVQIIDKLMDEYSDAILHLAYTYVKNETTAEDLTQEIFIKSFEKLHQFNERSTLKTWLYRIASNHCKDYLKSWHYRKITLNDKIFDYIPSRSKTEDEIIAKDEEDILANAVMELPLKYREVVFLHYYEELSLKEINKITAMNTNTLKTRLKRAKEILRQKMTKEAE